jgi:membrane protein
LCVANSRHAISHCSSQYSKHFISRYKVLPRVRIAWRDVWVGVAVTSLLFAIGKFLIGLYIGKSSVASSYGAAGAIVIVLLWVYYSAQIFLLGAECTRAYAELHSSRSQSAGESRGAQQALDKHTLHSAPSSGS